MDIKITVIKESSNCNGTIISAWYVRHIQTYGQFHSEPNAIQFAMDLAVKAFIHFGRPLDQSELSNCLVFEENTAFKPASE